MKFGALHKAYFDADDGAYSIVTEDERKKGQITLTETDGEAQIAIGHFEALGITIPREASQGLRLPVRTSTSIKDWKDADLTINYPKSQGNELRIYRGAKNAFGYESGDVWYIFVKNNILHVGSMPEIHWHRMGMEDLEDAAYQRAAETGSESPILSTISGVVYRRRPALVTQSLRDAKYQREYSPATALFTSKATGNPYLEAHHLVPLYATSRVGERSLDVAENIIALAPHWHRAIHSAEEALVMNILRKLTSARPEIMHRCGITVSDLALIYGCEKIR